MLPDERQRLSVEDGAAGAAGATRSPRTSIPMTHPGAFLRRFRDIRVSSSIERFSKTTRAAASSQKEPCVEETTPSTRKSSSSVALYAAPTCRSCRRLTALAAVERCVAVMEHLVEEHTTTNLLTDTRLPHRPASAASTPSAASSRGLPASSPWAALASPARMMAARSSTPSAMRAASFSRRPFPATRRCPLPFRRRV